MTGNRRSTSIEPLLDIPAVAAVCGVSEKTMSSSKKRPRFSLLAVLKTNDTPLPTLLHG